MNIYKALAAMNVLHLIDIASLTQINQLDTLYFFTQK